MKKTIFLLTGILLLCLMLCSCSKTEHNTYADIYGIVSDAATGSPVSDATVMLSPGGKTQLTGSDGRFEFSEVEAMQYTVTVQKTGYQTNRKIITAGAGEKTEVNIPLTKNN